LQQTKKVPVVASYQIARKEGRMNSHLYRKQERNKCAFAVVMENTLRSIP